jgi:hypothetical protein
MLSFRACDATVHPVVPAIDWLLDRDEDPTDPGEAGA